MTVPAGPEFLNAIIAKLQTLPPDQLKALAERAAADPRRWIANPGRQAEALNSPADELFYGGSPGAGKSSLLIGAAITQHERSIIFRREYPQIRGLEDEAARILGGRDGYNQTEKLWKIPGTDKVLEFGSCPHEWDVERYQGRAHSLKGFDEIAHFSRSQYRYLTLWLRSATPGQRCRIIATGNPPTSPEGFWICEHWAAWIDPTYHDPALPGELRWPAPAEEGSEKEIFFRTSEEAIAHLSKFKNPPRDTDGSIIPPRSRTFIPGKLEDNPDLVRTGYSAVLAFAPKNLQALAKGQFDAQLEDDPWQLIPTQWIIDAQKRWTPQPPKSVPMVAMGVDVAQGGTDKTALAWRHDCWFAPLVMVPGSETPLPSDVAGLIVRHRRDGAAVIVDCGGGYGGGVAEQLETHNQIAAVKYKGSAAGVGRSKCRTYAFANARAATWWAFREALDPEQPNGSPIALPNDPQIRADLAAPRFKSTPRGILLEEKAEIAKRLGRSPDAGDAIVLAWSEGEKALQRGLVGPGSNRSSFARTQSRPEFMTVGHGSAKAKYRKQRRR